MIDDTIVLVLAGDRGERLLPLTQARAKAAIPFGGEYRIVDFCLTNCLHSGLRRILVLTEHNTLSLLTHLRDGWSIFNPDIGEYVTPVPPPSLSDGRGYAGTADALRRNLALLGRSGARQVLVLPGDHIYRMDYASLLEAHRAAGTAVTVACAELPAERAGDGPTLVLDNGRISERLAPGAASPGRVSVSMGIFVFATESLAAILSADAARPDSGHDLDEDVLPAVLAAGPVGAYRFGGSAGRVSQDRYWSEVRDIDAYFEANMALLEPVPPLDLYQETWPIWSYPGKNPPARTVSSASGNEGIFVNSIVSNGTVITGGAVSRSVLCPRVRVEDSATVERAVLFNGVRVGAGAQVRNCIVEKYVAIPPGDRIGFDPRTDAKRFPVSPRGVVVVTAEALGQTGVA
jgi:glucose-1-phosphate adenylyltransferase